MHYHTSRLGWDLDMVAFSEDQSAHVHRNDGPNREGMMAQIEKAVPAYNVTYCSHIMTLNTLQYLQSRNVLTRSMGHDNACALIKS